MTRLNGFDRISHRVGAAVVVENLDDIIATDARPHASKKIKTSAKQAVFNYRF